MANLSEENRDGKIYRRIQFVDAHKIRRSIRLPGVSERDARALCDKIDELVSRQMTGAPLSAKLTEWLERLPDAMHDKLSSCELVEKRQRAKLGEYIDRYIADRRESLAPSTVCNFEQAKRSLIAFWGEDVDIRDVTAEDAKKWHRSLAGHYAEATVSKLVKRARQVFKSAVEEGACYSNPLAALRAGEETNPERKVFVSQETIEKAIQFAPDAEWRAIIALSRFGGLRCPSEIVGLRWVDVDFVGGVFKITSPKTKKLGRPFRVCPIFERLRPHLWELYELSPPGTEFVINRYRRSESNLRTQFERILRKASIVPWERLFHNLRSSVESELTSEFPLHVVTEWLGHSPRTAAKHYLQVLPSHIAQANGSAKATDRQKSGGAASGAIERQRTEIGTQKNPENSTELEDSGVLKVGLAPPVGLEKGAKTSRKQAVSDVGGAASSSIAIETSEFEPLAKLQQAISLANADLTAAAAGEALAAISSWIRHLAQLHKIEATIDSQATLCQVVDALVDGDALSRTQVAQVDTMVDFLSACVYGAPRSSQSLSAILESAAVLLSGK